MNAPSTTSAAGGEPEGRVVRQGGRLKAYRPLEPGARRAAFEAALEAYAGGDFFLTHELLEPAWMGTDDLAERALHQGLIKLAAGYVHAVRGNPRGLAKNLEGARHHLAMAGPAAGAYRVDLAALQADLAARLPVAGLPPDPLADAPAIRRTEPA